MIILKIINFTAHNNVYILFKKYNVYKTFTLSSVYLSSIIIVIIIIINLVSLNVTILTLKLM